MRSYYLDTLKSIARLASFSCLFMVALLTDTSGQELVDSSSRDSIRQVVQAEETAALIPANYAELIIKVDDTYKPEMDAAQSIVFDTEILALRDQFNELSRLTDYVLARDNVLEGIKTLELKWRDQLEDVSQYADELKVRTNDVIELKKDLSEARAHWMGVQGQLIYGSHPDEIKEYTRTSIDTIDYFLNASAMVIDTFTVMYTDVVDLLLGSREFTERLKTMRQTRLATLLTEKKAPIWGVGLFAGAESFTGHWNYLKTIGASDVRYYISEHAAALRQLVFAFFLFTFIFYWTRSRSLMLDDDDEPELVRNVHVLQQPLIMGLFATIISASLILPNLPPLLSYAFSFLTLVCIISILTKMMTGRAKWIGYVLALLYLLMEINEFISGGEEESRWLSLTVSVTVCFMMYWVWKNRKFLTAESQPGNWPRLFVLLSFPMGLVSLLAIASNVIGYSSASSFLNHGAVLVLIIGLLLLSMFKSLMSVVYHFFHTTFARNSAIIKEDGDRIFQRLTRLLMLSTFGMYIYYCLSFFLLWEPVLEIVMSVWNFGYSFGAVELTVGDVVNVFMTIFIFWVLASILRLFLSKELFSRVSLPRGVGNAVSSMAHYILVVVGVFLALASAGFETRHLGILAGALGVGIGFGLQNIVNNFLSGLILVFERPIAVDDVIVVDDVLGVVTSIGIRSSKIRQFNGDEVIVPNADLISKRVTNRTLSDSRRRYTMTFETGRGVEPERVLRIITEAAQQVEGVLADPAVKAYFKGMGQQTILFYVNYWGAGNFLDLMSEVEMTVYKALERENIQMPIPIQIEIQKD